jgi:ankyrin repeat protein
MGSVSIVALSQDGKTALIEAAAHNQMECVRLLLDLGVDKEATDKVRFVEALLLFI